MMYRLLFLVKTILTFLLLLRKAIIGVKMHSFKKTMAWSIFKQEKSGGVAMRLSAGSQRPAMPVISRNFGLSSAKSR
ncbi:hypothetical protein AALA61_14380 [Oscillospiraceae bacterium 42-9]